MRSTPVGCPDCRNGTIDYPFRRRTDRRGYSDDYDSDYEGTRFEDSSDQADGTGENPLFGGGEFGGAGASMAFTEADGASLTNTDESFEDDLSAS